MIIRNAKASDAKQIREISLHYNVSRYSKKKGFVEFDTPTVKGYSKLISKNPYFYVAETGKTIAGFLSNFSSQKLRDLKKRDEIVRYLLSTNIEPFIYTEQLAVLRKYVKEGIGSKLLQRLCDETKYLKYHEIFGAISLQPNKNTPIIKTVERFGFRLVEVMDDSNGLTFGIYKKEL